MRNSLHDFRIYLLVPANGPAIALTNREYDHRSLAKEWRYWRVFWCASNSKEGDITPPATPIWTEPIQGLVLQ